MYGGSKMARKKYNVKIGDVFGNWTVIGEGTPYINKKGYPVPRWLVRCSCEKHTIKELREDRLTGGTSKSCGSTFDKRIKENKFDLSGDYGIGWTVNTNKEFYFDLCDYDKIKDICWSENSKGYAWGRNIPNGERILMHNLIGYSWHDHISRNKMDNRSSNLRPCTAQENRRNSSIGSNNTSGIIGVSWCKQHEKWHSYIKFNKKLINLGYFTNKKDAIVERLKAEKQYFGAFAPQQHLYEQYGIEV